MKEALDKIKLYGTVNREGGVLGCYFRSQSSWENSTFPRAAGNTQGTTSFNEEQWAAAYTHTAGKQSKAMFIPDLFPLGWGSGLDGLSHPSEGAALGNTFGAFPQRRKSFCHVQFLQGERSSCRALMRLNIN